MNISGLEIEAIIGLVFWLDATQYSSVSFVMAICIMV